MAANWRHKRRFWLVAIGLLIAYSSITVAINLLHNHNTLEQRVDCPACTWLQISQDIGPDGALIQPSMLDLYVIALLPPPVEVGLLHGRDTLTYNPIRAPPVI